MKSLCLIFMSLCLLSCGDSKLPKYIELKELRVLGLIADTPEIDPGGTATITAIVSDINETTGLTDEAKACVEPGVGYGAEPTCEGNPTAVTVKSGTVAGADMSLAKGFTGIASSFSITAPASGIIFAQRTAQDQFNGISYLVTYKVTNSAGLSVKSFKRIIVSTRPSGEKNHNPSTTAILNSGAAFSGNTLPAGQALTISPQLGSPAGEAYTYKLADGSLKSRQEELSTTWFISDGELKYYRTIGAETNQWTAPGTAPVGRDVYLLAVTRDGRGGLSFQKKCFGTCL